MARSQLGTPGDARRVTVASPSTLLLLVVVFLLGWGFVAFSPPGSHVAAWWPAAGVSVLLVLRLHRSQRVWGAVAVVVVTTLSNMVGGREFVVAIFFGIANSAEAWLVAVIVTRSARARPVLDSLAMAYRLCVAVAAGALLIGILAGLTVAVFDGGSFVDTLIGVSAAHATAVLIILPFALLPHASLARVHRAEILAQLVIMSAVLLYVFGPDSTLPLSFLPLPIIAWAAFRFPTRIVLFEIVGIAIAVTLLTTAGGGPFDQAVALGGNPSTLIQVFLLSVASFVLLATSSQNESRLVTARLRDREEVLRGGFVGSRVGLLIVEPYPHGFVVLESNEIASSVIAPEQELRTDSDGNSVALWHGPLAAKVAAAVEHHEERVSWQADVDGVRSDIDVLIVSQPSSSGVRYSIQLVDVSAARRVAEAHELALEKEQMATARVTELNRQKEEFVASASHELRTPITSIIGYVELLEEEELDDFQRASVETIARNARRLADLVESLLELGRPRDPSTAVASSDFTVTAHEVIGSLRPLAERNEIVLTVESGPPVCAALPPIELDRILTNVVNNAIKFTPGGGAVTIGATPTATEAVITITDTGIGMDSSVIEHIFERFYRAPDAEERGITGTGLGLPLVRGLVQKHLGSVAVTSVPGEGSTFTVTLPLAVPSPLAPEVDAGPQSTSPA
ncbi:ATP-binding protein [Salinibacterium sp. SWN167]|uniref:ATP-binding protein n=1 Tax=Salinibacterium sp. SWN167 TaxID=2792054 RepID=UPI0018CD2055|nr:ATP-binding protein [Salinibacterium sp. SWN167]MBH0082088.1 MASE1 domain-containing protein [Salinibacterium sp. SWN167]